MKYVKGNCPICGSLDIKELGVETDELGNETTSYMCEACGGTFVAKPRNIEDDVKIKGKSKDESIYEYCMKSVIEITISLENSRISGTGFFISKDLVLTNAHVAVRDPEDYIDSYTIKGNFYKSNEKFTLSIVYADVEKDICLCKASIESDHFIKMTEELALGEKIFAIGNTIGEGLCVANGIVSDCSRMIDGNEYFMYSAIVFHGNSGGPVFNEKCELLGISTLGSKRVVSMNYGIPVKVIKKFLETAKKKK